MGVAREFDHAIRRAGVTQPVLTELLPSLLARAALDVLPPTAGVGIGLFSDRLRLPLGSSGDDAAAAERLQFTVGAGPCLLAVDSDAMIIATETMMMHRWPAFHEAFRASTPYRSVISAPLQSSTGVNGAIDLYFHTPTLGSLVDLVDLEIVRSEIARRLDLAGLVRASVEATLGRPDGLPASARERSTVWIAVGMVIDAAGLGASDALARIRSVAFARDTTVDDVVRQIVDHSLPLSELEL